MGVFALFFCVCALSEYKEKKIINSNKMCKTVKKILFFPGTKSSVENGHFFQFRSSTAS